jgi:hypothetical protein
MDPILLSPGPKFATGKKVAGPEEMQAIVRWAREVQTAFNTLQRENEALRARVTALENGL